VKPVFPKIIVQKVYPILVIASPNGQTLADRSSLIFSWILIVLFLVCSKDKIKYLSFLLHCPMIVLVILSTVEKSLILPGLDIFDIDENMLNNMIIDLFLLVLVKRHKTCFLDVQYIEK
jgi:hypothetical protein